MGLHGCCVCPIWGVVVHVAYGMVEPDLQI